MSRSQQRIRFGVGTDEAPYSTIWDLWAHRNEVYLSARGFGGVMKVSLHSGHVWTLSIPKEAWRREPDAETRNRRLIRWERPAEFAPGWTAGPGIIVPASDVQRWPIEPRRPVTWLPRPAPGNKILFSVLFGAPRVASDDAVRSVLRACDALVGDVRLTDGQRVWLCARDEPLTPVELGLMGEIRIAVRPGSDPGALIGATAISYGSSKEGSPSLFDLPVGPENVDVEGEPTCSQLESGRQMANVGQVA